MLIFWVALFVLAVDQFSKYWIMYAHVAGALGYTGSWYDVSALRTFLGQSAVEQMNAIPQDGKFIVLSFTPNDAAMWGLGSGNPWAGRLLLALTAVFVFLLVFFTVRSRKALPKLSEVIVGLLIGGSIGNLFDRVAFGYVRDMICTRFITFPVFNVADSAICIAIALLLFEAFFKKLGVFECFEDAFRELFRLPTREEAEQAAKERKKNKLSRFEELIPEDEEETDAQPENAQEAENTDGDGNDAADRGDGSGEN